LFLFYLYSDVNKYYLTWLD